MATVTKLVTEFSFKGSTKPLKEAGDQMQRVSENSGVATQRMDSADKGMMNLNKSAIALGASLVIVAKGIQSSVANAIDLGKEASNLRALGVDMRLARDFEDLFVAGGAGEGAGTEFVKEFTKAMAQLELGDNAPFFRAMADEFSVNVQKGERALDVIKKIRKEIQRQGLTPSQVSVGVSELGLDTRVTNLLTLSEQRFIEAQNTSAKFAKLNEKQIKSMEEMNQSWENFNQKLSATFDDVSANLAPFVSKTINVLDSFVNGVDMVNKKLFGDERTSIFDINGEGGVRGAHFSSVIGSRPQDLPVMNDLFGRLAPQPTASVSEFRESMQNVNIQINVTEKEMGMKLESHIKKVLGSENRRVKRSR